MDALAPAHRDNRLLAIWPPETLPHLTPHLKHVSLAQGTVLLEPGDEIDQIYFPQTGMISLLVVTKDGTTIETSTIGRDGFETQVRFPSRVERVQVVALDGNGDVVGDTVARQAREG